MAFYPVNLRLEGRKAAVFGGGAVAARKAAELVAAGAEVTVISPLLTQELQCLAAEGVLHHLKRAWRPGDGAGFFLLFCATDDAAVNRAAAAEGKRFGALVNVADAPELCDFTLPGQVRRGDLLLTVSTGGKSPAFARRMRQELERQYGDDYGNYLELLGELRAEVRKNFDAPAKRQLFWRMALDEEMFELIRAGKFKDAEARIRNAIGSTGTQS